MAITKQLDRRLIQSINALKAAGELTRPYDMSKVGPAAAALIEDDADLAALVVATAQQWDAEKAKPRDQRNDGLMWLTLGFTSAYRERFQGHCAQESTGSIIYAILNSRHLHEIQAPEDEPEQIHLSAMERTLEDRYPEVRAALDERLPSWEELAADTRPLDVVNAEARARDIAAYMIAAELRGDLHVTPWAPRPLAICA